MLIALRYCTYTLPNGFEKGQASDKEGRICAAQFILTTAMVDRREGKKELFFTCL